MSHSCHNVYSVVRLNNLRKPTLNDQYIAKLTSEIDEACKLLEVGFECVTDMDGKKLFRKRK
jgi:hypothetical protein